MSWARRIILLAVLVGLIPLYLTTPRYVVEKGTAVDVTGSPFESIGRIDLQAGALRLIYYLSGAAILYAVIAPPGRRDRDASSNPRSIPT